MSSLSITELQHVLQLEISLHYNLAAGPTEVISLYNNVVKKSRSDQHQYARLTTVMLTCVILAGDLSRKILCCQLVLIALRGFR